MKLSDWHVYFSPAAECKRVCYYGPLSEACEILSPDYMVISRDEWTVEDMAAIAQGLLEDNNLHRRGDEPRQLVDMMRAVDICDEKIKAFMATQYLPWLFNRYGEGY